MRSIRRLARLLLAGIFISGGISAYLNPEPRARQAKPVLDWLSDNVPGLPSEPAEAVKLNALAHLGAGAALALGILPRLSALVLAGSLVPTTFGGHRFWELEDSAQRAQQQVHFLKNAAILGGLLLVAFD